MLLRLASTLCFLVLAGSVLGTDLTIHLPEKQSISRQSRTYQCDANGSKIGVPPGSFAVEYINGGGNRLVVIPISGNALIFTDVLARSGARYSAQQYTWWESRGSVFLVSDSITGKIQSTCQLAGRK